MVSWLEDTRICRYDRSDKELDALRNIHNPTWEASFQKYLDFLHVPDQIDRSKRSETVAWLLSIAIQYQYNDNDGGKKVQNVFPNVKLEIKTDICILMQQRITVIIQKYVRVRRSNFSRKNKGRKWYETTLWINWIVSI